MFSIKDFTPDSFVQQVLLACKFHNLPEHERHAIEMAIHQRLAERIVATIMNNFGVKEAEMYDNIFRKNPDTDEIDAIVRVAAEMPGAEEKVNSAIQDLFEELTHDADEIEKAIKSRTTS